MSKENVEAFRHGEEASNRRDVDGVLEVLDAEVEWHGVIQALLGGEAMTYRGHAGVREFYRDAYEAFSEFRAEYPEVRDLGDRLIAIGHLHVCGRHSGAEIESPVALMLDFKNGKLIRLVSYLDPKEALEAAGLSE